MAQRRRLRIEADGGSRGNPGVAGYGALVRDADGTVLAERAAPLGKASNNVAEYRGLIAGLEAVLAIDPAAEVTAALDSKLVVEQMSGRWKIKHEDMRRLALQARDLVGEIKAAGGSVGYRWIPREQNKDADALSNDGMDGVTVCRGAGCPGAPAADAHAARPADPSNGEPGNGDPSDGDPGGADAAAPDAFGPDAGGLDVAAEEQADPVAYLAPSDPWPSGEPTRLVLVRHGVTPFTEQLRLDGRGGADPSLSETGREQAASAARQLVELIAGQPVSVTTSTLARAVETGAIVASTLGADPIADPDWDEQNFGDWDGAAMPELLGTSRTELGHLRVDATYARPGGESHAELARRVLTAYRRVVAAGGIQVVVCHRKPIMVVLAEVLGISQERAWRVAAAPGSLTAIEAWPNGSATVAFTNRT